MGHQKLTPRQQAWVVQARRDGQPYKKILQTLSAKGIKVSRKTLERIVTSQMEPAATLPTGDAWSLLSAAPDELLAVPPVLAVVSRARGRPVQLSKTLARAVTQVRHAAPDAGEWLVHEVARAYEHFANDPTPRTALDVFIGAAPWRDRTALAEYNRMIEIGVYVPAVSPYLIGMAELDFEMREDAAKAAKHPRRKGATIDATNK